MNLTVALNKLKCSKHSIGSAIPKVWAGADISTAASVCILDCLVISFCFIFNIYWFGCSRSLVVACRIFSCVMWGSSSLTRDPAQAGLPLWECGVLATGPPGKSFTLSFSFPCPSQDIRLKAIAASLAPCILPFCCRDADHSIRFLGLSQPKRTSHLWSCLLKRKTDKVFVKLLG